MMLSKGIKILMDEIEVLIDKQCDLELIKNIDNEEITKKFHLNQRVITALLRDLSGKIEDLKGENK